MKTRNETVNIILKYTFIFIFISSFIAFIYLKNKRGFIGSGGDSFNQHLITLTYFKDLLKNFLINGNFQTFTWHISAGMDMFANLAYYIFGDFVSYLSIFVPENKLYLLYYALTFLRTYLVGITFIIYCRYHKFNKLSTLIGALMYTFCGFMIYNQFRHPYFTNSVAIFPLLMMGMEKIVKENKKSFYVFIVFLTTICNFYFAYTFFIIIGIYALILIYQNYKKEGFKVMLKKLVTVIIYSLLGVALSSFILIPTIYAFLSSSRISTGNYFYSLSYYRNFIPSLILFTNEYWRIFTVNVLILITLPYFIKHYKENKPIFYLTVILLLSLLSAKISSALVGFSFPVNRFSFTVAFLLAFISASFFNQTQKLTSKDKKFIFRFIIGYFLIVFVINIGIDSFLLASIITLAILIYIIFNDKLNAKLKNYGILITLVCGLCYTAYNFYDVSRNNYSKEFYPFNAVNYMYNTNKENNIDLREALKYIKKQEQNARILINPDQIYNLALIRDFNTMNYYYSLNSKEILSLALDLKNNDNTTSNAIKKFDNRPRITTLLGNKYYIIKDGYQVPYGYEKTNYKGPSKIYKNKYALPLAVYYDQIISLDDYEKLSPLEKEVSLLKQVAIKTSSNNEINLGNELTTYDFGSQKMEITNTNNKITLKLKEPIKDSEVYLYITNLKYTPYTKEEMINNEYTALTNNDSNLNHLNELAKIKYNYRFYEPADNFNLKIKYGSKSASYYTLNSYKDSYYFDKSTVVINLGYFKEFKDDIEITTNKPGYYAYDSVSVVKDSLKDYEQDIENLKRSNFEIEKYEDGLLEGVVNIENNAEGGGYYNLVPCTPKAGTYL